MSFFPKIAFQYEVEEYLTKVFRNNEVCDIVTPNHEKKNRFLCNFITLQ